MPSVTMNPFSRPLTMSRPFTRPTAAPTASTMRMPRNGFSLVPEPNAAAGTISQAATMGASP